MTKKKGIVTKWIITVVLVLFGLVCIYPFLFTVSSAFKPTGEVLSTPLQLIPEHFTLQNMKTVFANPYFDFGQWYMNTVVMTVCTLVLLAGLMIPSDVMIMPRYMLFKELGILNTMWSLVLPAAVDVYFVFMLRQAFIAIPDSIRWSSESGRPRRARCARPPASACTISMPESGCMSRAVRCASPAKRNGAPP
ncbi:MAG: hypothetical protein SOY27_05895 [Fournierella sp.]|uniref:carbohydrate ABC transporter permease n=1 Tax=Allofournierella sp. TaxID=1940256 RepID=UPI002A83E8B8|nr:hypothetical protein [Fournierella sp.]MDY4167007.1 hypothetical protein [Fournierella sp.]